MYAYQFIITLLIVTNICCKAIPVSSLDNTNSYFEKALEQPEFIHTYRNYQKIAPTYFSQLPKQPGANDYPPALIDYSGVLKIIQDSHYQDNTQAQNTNQWLNQNVPSFLLNKKNGYIQKVTLSTNAQVIFFGDLHGSIQSFIRVLSKSLSENSYHPKPLNSRCNLQKSQK